MNVCFFKKISELFGTCGPPKIILTFLLRALSFFAIKRDICSFQEYRLNPTISASEYNLTASCTLILLNNGSKNL